MITTEVNKDFVDYRLDKFLCEKFDISFALAQKLIREKKVKVNDRRVDSAYRVEVEDQIKIYSDLALRKTKAPRTDQISLNKIAQFYEKFFSNPLYEDENLIAIDKPSGLATQGGTGIEFCIDDALKVKKYQLVHRLDKDTSGILLIAKDNQTADKLTLAFKNKDIDKTYLALVYNLVKKDHGIINIPLIKKNLGKNDKVLPDHIDGKIAITNYEVLHRFTNFTLLKLMPVTGRTHQIRVHCKEIGYPVLNDVKYGGTKVLRKELSPRLCLHAYKITINGYLSEPLTIISELPDFLKKFKKFIP
jgi:23S rRNA pseudouridine955/2504/2580 synthase